MPTYNRFQCKAKVRTTRRQPGTMNKTETKYATHLAECKLMGEIVDWAFEPEKLRLADLTFFSPDFRIIKPDGTVEFHEVKAAKSDGRPLYEDDARVKIKVAAEQHWMYQFVGAYLQPKKLGGGWTFEKF